MISATGRHIASNLTESGRAAQRNLTETGEYAPTVAPLVKPCMSLLLTVGGPGYSAALAGCGDISAGGTMALAATVTVGGPGYSAALAGCGYLSGSASAVSVGLIDLFGPGHTAALSAVMELTEEQDRFPQNAALSLPHPHANAATVYAPLQLGVHGIGAGAWPLSLFGPGSSAAVAGLLNLSEAQAAASMPLSLFGPGSSAAVAGLLNLSEASAAAAIPLAIDPPAQAAACAVPVPLEVYAGAVALSMPLALADSPTITGLTDYRITLDGVDITRLVDDCTMQYDDGTMFGTVSISLPVAVTLPSVTGRVIVTAAGLDHHYQVEDVEASGPSRTIWGRSIAAVIDAPVAVESAWDESADVWTAAGLAALLAGSVPLSWQIADWPLPPSWSLSGTPAAALQQLAAAVGAVVRSTPSGGLVVAPRFSVRPPNMPGAATVAEISRETAISFSARQEHGKKWGAITVNGYDPSADLPGLDVEESDPVHGLPVHVRARWRSSAPPTADRFITDGTAQPVGSGTEIITEQVIFEAGMGSVKHPIRELTGFYWVGRNGGSIWWLEHGDSQELEMTDPDGYGIAMISYRTAFERFRLTGQVEDVVQFGLSVSGAAVAARVALASGGPEAPQLINPLLGDTAAAIAAGTAALDAERNRWIIAADVPLTGPELVPGALVRLHDEVAGIIGTGQITGITTSINPERTTQTVEVILCN